MPTVRSRIEQATAKQGPSTDRSTKKAKIEPQASTPMDIRLGLTSDEMLSQPLRWGIIGASNISSDWSKCLQEVPGTVLEAVAARSAQKAEKFRVDHGINKVHETYEKLCADPGALLHTTAVYHCIPLLYENATAVCRCRMPLLSPVVLYSRHAIPRSFNYDSVATPLAYVVYGFRCGCGLHWHHY